MTDNNRNYILDRIRSKTVSIEEFNYDKLQAPPIAALFTYEDIAQLNRIARSIKLSAKPIEKEKMIDQIMRRRGFVKLAGGTNRLVYRCVEINTIIVKVALDAVGLGDNPKEFRNQMIFKPFVTKVFEVTPCGTLGLFERVNPITSREQFLSVAEDIYEVINNWFIGEYVLEDIGTEYFMNYGIRSSFGPVLLDFPYAYKLDGDKLFCNAPNYNSPTGCCEGVIDYDPGFNYLYCTKCGVKYIAAELQKAIEEDKIIVKSKGDVKMKIELKGGSKNVNSEVVTGKYADMSKAMPSKPIKGKVEQPKKVEVVSKPAVEEVKTVNGIAPEKAELTSEKLTNANSIVNNETEGRKNKTVEVKLGGVKEDTTPKKEVICPIEFDESLIKKENKPVTDEDCIDKMSEVIEMVKSIGDKFTRRNVYFAFVQALFDEIEKDNKNEQDMLLVFSLLVESMTKIMENVKDESVKAVIDETLTKALSKKIDEIMDSKSKEEKKEVICPIEFDESLIKKEELSVYEKIDNIAEELKSIMEEDGYSDGAVIELFDSEVIQTIISDKAVIGIEPKDMYRDEDSNMVVVEVTPSLDFYERAENEDGEDRCMISLSLENITIGITDDNMKDALTEAGYNVSIATDDEYAPEGYGPLAFYAGKVVNSKEISNSDESSKVIVLIDEDGNYVTKGAENNIVAVDLIDDRSINSLAFVSADYFNKLLSEVESSKEETIVTEDIIVEHSTEEVTTIPTGVFAPTTDLTVNGVK